MTNVLTLAKAEIADTLNTAGIKAFDYVPERIQPPTAILVWGSPFIEKGLNPTFTDVEMRLNIRLVAQTATNVKSTEELDGLIVKAILALQTINWDIESVSQPFGYEANNALYLATDLTVVASITINEEVV
jgi:hypothetical protein